MARRKRRLLILATPAHGMVPLPGERRDDCAHYSACLRVLALEHPHAEDGSCSPKCVTYWPGPRS